MMRFVHLLILCVLACPSLAASSSTSSTAVPMCSVANVDGCIPSIVLAFDARQFTWEAVPTTTVQTGDVVSKGHLYRALGEGKFDRTDIRLTELASANGTFRGDYVRGSASGVPESLCGTDKMKTDVHSWMELAHLAVLAEFSSALSVVMQHAEDQNEGTILDADSDRVIGQLILWRNGCAEVTVLDISSGQDVLFKAMNVTNRAELDEVVRDFLIALNQSQRSIG